MLPVVNGLSTSPQKIGKLATAFVTLGQDSLTVEQAEKRVGFPIAGSPIPAGEALGRLAPSPRGADIASARDARLRLETQGEIKQPKRKARNGRSAVGVSFVAAIAMMTASPSGCHACLA
jgi:hypothetical protein